MCFIEFQKAGGKKLVYASLPGAELVKKPLKQVLVLL